MSYVDGPNARKPPVWVGKEETASGETLEYGWFCGDRGHFEGVIVIRTDRFGQRWFLEMNRGSYITVRVAAGLLGVSPMSISNWLKAGVFPNHTRRNNAMVIPVRDVERVAVKRGIQLPFPK